MVLILMLYIVKISPFGIDTVEDYVEIKKIMEYKIKKL